MPIFQILTYNIGLSRAVAAIIVTLLTYCCITIVILLIAPMVYNQLMSLANIISSIKPHNVLDKVTSNPFFQELYSPEVQKYTTQLFKIIKNNTINLMLKHSSTLTNSILTSTSMILTVLFNITFAPLISFYMIRDQNILKGAIHDISTQTSIRLDTCINYLHNVALKFLQVQILIILIYSAYYCLLLSILQIQNSLLLGAMCGIFYTVPYIGIIVSLFVCLTVSVIQYGVDVHILLLVCGFLLCSIIDFIFINPHIAGSRFGLHPLLTIAGVLFSATLFGILGLVFALPLTFMMKDIIIYVYKHILKIKNNHVHK